MQKQNIFFLVIVALITFYSYELEEPKSDAKLIIKNNSTVDINKFRVWIPSEAFTKAAAEWYIAQGLLFLDPGNPDKIADVFLKALKCAEEEAKICDNPPFFSVDVPIKPGETVSWTFSKDHGYIFKANNDSKAENTTLSEGDVFWVYEAANLWWQEY